MSSDSPGAIVLVVALVIVASLLNAAEAALSDFSRARAGELAQERRVGARALQRIVEEPARYLNATLFLQLIAEISAVVLATLMIDGTANLRRSVVVLISIAVMTLVSFVLIGVGSRTLGRQHSERTALAAAPVIVVLARVLGPIPRLLIVIGNALTPGRGFSQGPFASEVELREMVDLAEASSLIESDERAMIHSVFDLGDTYTREVMVPRTDVVYIERHKTLRQAMSLFLRSGFSRLPVIEDDLDDVAGLVYLKDVARRVFDKRDAESQEHVETIMRPVLWVPDSKPVDDLLREMQVSRRHIAIVVDEYGGTAGLVTIEDILEEIVGEITDEFDPEEAPVEFLDDGSIRVSSRFPVDDLAEEAGVPIQDDDVDSVGGLMAKHLGRVPLPGAVVEIDGITLRAEEAKGRRNKIGTVVIVPKAPSEDDASPEG